MLRKILPIIIIFSLILIGVAWSAQVPFNHVNDYGFSSTHTNFHQAEFVFQLGDLNIESRGSKGGDFAFLRIDGAGYTREIGEPMLPVVRRMVRIPYGANVTVTAQGDSEVLQLSDYVTEQRIIPVQPPVEKFPGMAEKQPFVISERAYAQAGTRFETRAKLIETGILRGQRFAMIELYPVDYNPVSGTVFVYPELTVTIEFSGADQEMTLSKKARYADQRTDLIAERMIDNAKAYDTKTNVTYFAPSSYLVIGDSSLIYSQIFEKWVNWKIAKGFDVVLADLGETGTGRDAIKSFIKNAYENWERPPSFVLLVGDTDTIPNYVGVGSGSPATDLYYATLEGEDMFIDVGIGRFSARNVNQLTNMVNKTVEYEQAGWTVADDWIKKATFMASRDRSWITEGTHNWVTDTLLTPNNYTVEKFYNRVWGTNITKVIAAFNAGTSLHNFSGHGDVREWVDGPSMTQNQVNNLNNVVYPYINSFACLTGQYTDNECFSETWLRTDNGAVGMLASSVSSFWDEDDVVEKGAMWGLFNGNQSPEKADFLEIPWFSGFTDFGKKVLYLYAGEGTTTTRYFEMYNLMGDPETMLWTEIPEVYEVIHPDTLEAPVSSVDVTVNGTFIFALVGISAEGEYLGSATVTPGQNTTINLVRTVDHLLDAKVTVTAHNMDPYQGDLLIDGDPLPDDDDDDDDNDTADDDDDDTSDDDDDDTSDDDDDDTTSDDDDDDNDDDDSSSGCCG